MFYLK